MTAGAVRASRVSDFAFTGLMAAMLVAGVLLRFYRLDAQSFWLDELWTAAASNPALPLDQWMSAWVLPDVHPPLYSFLAREWVRFFGDSEISLRALSLVPGLALVAVVPLVQRWEQVVREPLTLTAWLACSVGAVLFAQEARSYALLLLLTTGATLLAVAIAARMGRSGPVLAPAWVLAGVVVAAEYTHYFGALMGGALFGSLFLFAAVWHRRHLRTVVGPGLAAGGALLPWLAFHVVHLSDKFGGGFWVTNDWSTTVPAIAAYIAGSLEIFLIMTAAIAGMLAIRPHLLRSAGVFIPLVSMMLAILGAAIISFDTPVITRRNLLVLLPAFYVLAVTVLAEVTRSGGRKPWFAGRLAALVAVAASLVFSAYHLATDVKDQWREAAAEVRSLPGCRTATLQVYYWPEEVYAYYLPPPYRQNLRTVSIKPEEPDEGAAKGAVSMPAGTCPLILWSGHIVGDFVVEYVLGQLGLRRDQVIVRTTEGNMLILDRQRLASGPIDIQHMSRVARP